MEMYRNINGKRVKMTEAEIDKKLAEAAETEAYKDSIRYMSQRRKEYGSIEDQLDMMYHQGFDAWKQHIAAVKAKYPKPTE